MSIHHLHTTEICSACDTTKIISVITHFSDLNKFQKKKTLIEDTGCPYVSQDQMLVRNVCLMPYYQPNESPQQSILPISPHYVDVNLLKADILMVDEDNNKLTIHIIQGILHSKV